MMVKDVYVIARDYKVGDSCFSTDLLGIEETKIGAIRKTLNKAEKFWNECLSNDPGMSSLKVYDECGVRVTIFSIRETVNYYYFSTKIEIPD